MRRLGMAVAALTVVVFASGLSAQGKPNFAGKWTLQADPNAAAAGGGGGQRGRGMGGGAGFCGQECTITQDASTLKIDRMMGQNAVSTTYKLDGSESKNTMQMGRGPVEIVSKAAWEGDKLVISTTRDMNGTAMTTKTTVSMEGGNMVVETSGGMGGGQGMSTKQTYKKG
ncbi:MAG TPA: hypothetical protein VLT86_20200 [Vicinamibacterales bacterium]|nr:hypothetical protein [Vicinamibacterales bacterium]